MSNLYIHQTKYPNDAQYYNIGRFKNVLIYCKFRYVTKMRNEIERINPTWTQIQINVQLNDYFMQRINVLMKAIGISNKLKIRHLYGSWNHRKTQRSFLHSMININNQGRNIQPVHIFFFHQLQQKKIKFYNDIIEQIILLYFNKFYDTNCYTGRLDKEMKRIIDDKLGWGYYDFSRMKVAEFNAYHDYAINKRNRIIRLVLIS